MTERRRVTPPPFQSYRRTVLPPYRLLQRPTVVDDPRRDQDDQVATPLALGGVAEQLAHDRQAAQERDARPGLVHFGDREAADDRGLAVVHQELVVGLLLLEVEPEVRLRQN